MMMLGDKCFLVFCKADRVSGCFLCAHHTNQWNDSTEFARLRAINDETPGAWRGTAAFMDFVYRTEKRHVIETFDMKVFPGSFS